MIVLTLTKCPNKLRGDLTKWLLEINTGVYVGSINARVREALWKRVCENIGDGQATMVFSANNEQHMDFYVHNTAWKTVDLDGIKLIKHIEEPNLMLKQGFSNAAVQQMRKRRSRTARSDNSFVIIDIETTGLSDENDEILELGAIVIRNGICVKEYEQLIRPLKHIPENISRITGINNQMVHDSGICITDALPEYLEILSENTVLGYNLDFDIGFLMKACEKTGIEFPEHKEKDILSLAKSRLKGADSYKLSDISKRLGIDNIQEHRALADCKFLYTVYCKLNEI